MAANRELVLNSTLCFVFNSFHRDREKEIKRLLIDFYEGEVVTAAKSQLLSDVGRIVDDFPRFARRVDPLDRAVREVDDILSIVRNLDERKLIAKMPLYVSDSPEHMPSVRMTEGEFSLLLAKINKLDNAVSILDGRLSGSQGHWQLPVQVETR
jgi:hypothetical protein